jgi:hypothetical protein
MDGAKAAAVLTSAERAKTLAAILEMISQSILTFYTQKSGECKNKSF